MTEEFSKKSGRLKLRFGYAMGHVLNDLCCAMYFSYLLVFLQLSGLAPVQAGWVLIVGQVVDGLTTPIVGWLSDHFLCDSASCFGLGGKRKSWYMAGMVLVSVTFWALFTHTTVDRIPPTAYYSVANALFQVGWASVQVTHMTIVPELTPLLSERTILNSIRFSVQVGATVIVFLLLWVFAASSTVNEAESAQEDSNINENEERLISSLQVMGYIIIPIGVLCGLVFVCLVREKPSNLEMQDGNEDNVEQKEEPPAKTLRQWSVFRGFWGVTSNYAVTRLCVNALQVYIPFFVLYNMPDDRTAVATIPLVTFVGMSLSSAAVPWISSHIPGAAKLYTAGLVLVLSGAGIILFSTTEGWTYVAALLLGMGSAQLMITSQTLVGELVANDTNGGVVFGINSLGDKLSTGIAIFLLQMAAGEKTTNRELGKLYLLTATLVPSGCALLGLLTLSCVPRNIRDRHGYEEETVAVDEYRPTTFEAEDRDDRSFAMRNSKQIDAEEKMIAIQINRN